MSSTITLNHTESGTGRPVVLLHGFPLNGTIWHEQQQDALRPYQVIVPDLRGHGRSPAPAGVYDMDLLAGDVLALLDKLQVKKAVIMGHSMGGYVALAGYRLAPERFLALGLINSHAAADTEEGKQNRFKLAEKVVASGSKIAAEAMLLKLFAADLLAGSPIIGLVRQIMLNTQPAGIIGALKGMAGRPDSNPMLPGLKIPVLVMTGDKDQIIPPEKARATAAAIPGATLAIIENAGHMPMLEQPRATTEAIRGFLGGVK